jgi:hypothetical protein
MVSSTARRNVSPSLFNNRIFTPPSIPAFSTDVCDWSGQNDFELSINQSINSRLLSVLSAVTLYRLVNFPFWINSSIHSLALVILTLGCLRTSSYMLYVTITDTSRLGIVKRYTNFAEENLFITRLYFWALEAELFMAYLWKKIHDTK